MDKRCALLPAYEIVLLASLHPVYILAGSCLKSDIQPPSMEWMLCKQLEKCGLGATSHRTRGRNPVAQHNYMVAIEDQYSNIILSHRIDIRTTDDIISMLSAVEQFVTVESIFIFR